MRTVNIESINGVVLEEQKHVKEGAGEMWYLFVNGQNIAHAYSFNDACKNITVARNVLRALKPE